MQRGKEYYMEKIYPNISKKPIVFTGDTAMVWNGFSVSGIYIPDVLTEFKELSGLRLAGFVNYHYTPIVDREHYVRPFLGKYDNILVPSPERAIVENIKHKLEFVDEGYFCDALERYQHSKADFNYTLIQEVAEFFGVPMSEVDYWLTESSGYNSY